MKQVIKSNYKEEAILAMANVGRIKENDTTYEVSVNGKEGAIPHFHFDDMKNRKGIHVCIRIDLAEYSSHHERKRHIKNDSLNSDLRKELNKFMNNECFLGNITNWEFIKNYWNHESDYKIPDDITQPDYTELR